ncbi:MAG: 1-acyl-sn-glycerol-3-phosphate acyltransferase [Rickettsiales bacterium]|jgi:1-acyl-sn-glycerol-3-phosphate acyltransferase|nr:1-acyl-sn-glycerol-3-phosphate acyltransferase [Rickettsiales bacterium]
MFRTIITKTLIYAWFALASLVMLAGVVSPKAARLAMKISSGGALVIARVVGGIRYEVVGKIPARGIVAAKHMSMMETGILFHEIPGSFFVIKKELAMIPFYGWSLVRAGMLPVDRKRANMESLVRAASERMAAGGVMVIFPEGTRVAAGDGSRFKGGVVRIARATHAPITPVGLDTGLYWPKRGRMVPGTAKVIFGEALPWDASLEEIKEEIQKRSA